MTFLILLAALAAGLANPLQSGMNAALNKQLAQPLWTGIFVYASGLLALVAIQIFVRQPIPAGRLAGAPWWVWCGGLISIVSTVIALTLAQRLGSGLFTGITITASLLTSVLLDHFGLIGFKQHAASPARLAGCAFMVGGLWLIARF